MLPTYPHCSASWRFLAEVKDWYEMSAIILCCSSAYHLLLGLMVSPQTINLYFQGFLYCWLHQFAKSIAFVAAFEESPELQEIHLTNKLGFLSRCCKAGLKAEPGMHRMFSAPAVWQEEIIKLSVAELFLLLSAVQCWGSTRQVTGQLGQSSCLHIDTKQGATL